jgi:hypothetical protein
MNNKLGYIYCLSNPSFDKDVYKIGFTQNDPHIRKNKLYTTELPTPFKLEFAKKVLDYKIKEKQIHKILSKYRVNINREFFKLPLFEIKDIFELIDGEPYIDTSIVAKKKINKNITDEIYEPCNIYNNLIDETSKNHRDILHLYNSQLTTTLVKFGTEKLNTLLSESDMLNILNKGIESIEESIRCVHFNDLRPEFKNIYINNVDDEYAYIYDGNKFIAVLKEPILNDLLNKHFNNIKYWVNRYKIINAFSDDLIE